MHRGDVRKLNYRIINQTPYYKPTLPSFHHPDERIGEYPADLQDSAYNEAMPLPKFTFPD